MLKNLLIKLGLMEDPRKQALKALIAEISVSDVKKKTAKKATKKATPKKKPAKKAAKKKAVKKKAK